MSQSSYKIGDLIRPADGSNYRGEIILVSKEQDVIRHRCLSTGKVYEKSYFGFFCRYCTLDEYDKRAEEIKQEDSEIMERLKANPNLLDEIEQQGLGSK
jgi:hypothetical protein